MLRLIVLVVPLGLDTLVVSSAVGAGGLPARHRLRIALLFTLFEAGMPLVGLGLGASLSSAIGATAGDVAIALLVGLGAYLLLLDDGEAETEKVGRLRGPLGWGTLLLGLSISLDELAIGFSLGLLHLPTVPALVLIAVQAFVAAQLGLRLGARVGERLREGAEKLVGIGLIAIGLFLLAERGV